MEEQYLKVQCPTPEFWLDVLGGSTASEFKRALNNQTLLKKFIENHLFEAREIEDSYFNEFHQPIPQFIPFIPDYQETPQATAGESRPASTSRISEASSPRARITIVIGGFWWSVIAIIAAAAAYIKFFGLPFKELFLP